MGTLMMGCAPILGFLLERAEVATLDVALLDEAANTMQRPRPTGESVERRGRDGQRDLVNPADVVCPRWVTEPDA